MVVLALFTVNYILEDKNSYAFCNIYNFTSAGKNSKIKEITSYIIEVS